MKITVFNDTEMDWNLHSGSVKPVGGTNRILRHTSAEFEGPDRSDPFIKVWNGVVMVRFGEQAPVGWAPGIHPVTPPYVDPKTGLSRL